MRGVEGAPLARREKEEEEDGERKGGGRTREKDMAKDEGGVCV